MTFRNATTFIGVIAFLGLTGCDSTSPPESTAPTADPTIAENSAHAATVSVFATGLNFPRNFTWGNHGEMYVAEAGSGGSNSTTAEQCEQVIPPVGPYTNGPTARISRIDRHGNRTTLVDGLPSTVAAISDVSGVADLAFVRGRLYALLAGGGCSHGSANVPAAVLRIGRNGSWTVAADLSAYLATHPVAQPFAPDFEPDGSWYSMIRSWGSLVAVEPNHGDIVRVNPRTGHVTRIVDVSASQGHIVPTVIAERRGAFWVSSLGGFPVVPGTQTLLRISRRGHVRVVAEGFSSVLGIDFDRRGRLYLLETSPVAGFPTPNTGRVIRLDRWGHRDVIVDGLFFPTGMRFGPDGKLYIANKGFGPPQPGEILQVTVPGANDRGRHDEDMEQDED